MMLRELAAELEASGMVVLVGGLELLMGEVMIMRRNEIDAMTRRASDDLNKVLRVLLC